MTNTTCVTNQQLWNALRSIVPHLPQTTPKAVLRLFQDHASLEWFVVRDEATASYLDPYTYLWSTPEEVQTLSKALRDVQCGLPSLLQEARIEIRDLNKFALIEIDGRFLWSVTKSHQDE